MSASNILENSASEAEIAIRRSEQNCADGNYRAAFKEAARAIELDPSNVQGRIAASTASLHLRAFKDALSVFDGYENDLGAQDALLLAHNCYEEHYTGKLNVSQLVREARRSKRLMHGDYINPDIGLESHDGKRGLYALRDLKRGSTVIVEKAVFSVFPSDPPCDVSHLDSAFRAVPNIPSDPMIGPLIQKAMKTIVQHQIGGHIFNLHDPTAQMLVKLTRLRGEEIMDLKESSDSVEVPLQIDFKEDSEEWHTLDTAVDPPHRKYRSTARVSR
jgi:hypothetical protein